MNFQFFTFLNNETGEVNFKLILMTATSGLSNTLNLALINASVASMKEGGPFWQHFVIFGISLTLFVYSLRYILYESSRIAEKAVCNIRARLGDKIRRCDLQSLEKIGESDILARISRDTGMISQTTRPLFAATQAAFMVIFTLLYIAVESPIAVVLCGIMILCGAIFYMKDRDAYEKGLSDSSDSEDELAKSLTGLLRGFKEIRINQKKSDAVFADFCDIASTVSIVRTKVMQLYADTVVFIEMFFVILLGGVVFILPVISNEFAGTVTQIVAAILFFFGPLATVIMMYPVYTQANMTVDNLYRLERDLDRDQKVKNDTHSIVQQEFNDFKTIRFDQVGFIYADPDGLPSFQIGPITTTVNRGEILFLIGGNGSGKTSFMKLFTLLYLPTSGTIFVDDQPIDDGNIISYRNLFSAIFSDFYLFDKLYGVGDVPPERVQELLKLMGIAHKTGIKNGCFTNTNLSTGQRKRLALVMAYLEDKPVYIFDEVAADQDPQFRSYFYETLLPELKAAGKTILVVSHDDRYFHVADRILQMDYGQLFAYMDK
ncbi:cyclic peptide export ABC transporter [Methylobacter sp. Wu8]|uniref:cyclic peptide export ABC transporter n=1 Tax=Methylobacter sp. Wu8 TaxID=3118457 RepID=UPI002F2D8765